MSAHRRRPARKKGTAKKPKRKPKQKVITITKAEDLLPLVKRRRRAIIDVPAKLAGREEALKAVQHHAIHAAFERYCINRGPRGATRLEIRK